MYTLFADPASMHTLADTIASSRSSYDPALIDCRWGPRVQTAERIRVRGVRRPGEK